MGSLNAMTPFCCYITKGVIMYFKNEVKEIEKSFDWIGFYGNRLLSVFKKLANSDTKEFFSLYIKYVGQTEKQNKKQATSD